MSNSKLLFLFIFLLFVLQSAYTQNKYLQGLNSNISIGFDTKNVVGNLSLNRIHQLPIYKDLIKIGLGYGLRYTANFAQDAILSPSDTEASQRIIFVLPDVNTHVLNLGLYAQISIWKIDIGANIDAVGFSFGGSSTGVITSTGGIIIGGGVASSKPTSFNILKGFPEDEGNLQSERFYIRYWINEQMGLRVAMAHTFAEYELDEKRTNISTRFRHVTSPIMLGFTYKFW